jgi:hypothetical protein
MSGDWRGTVWTLLVTFCIVIIRCTETFWSPCVNISLYIRLYSHEESSAAQRSVTLRHIICQTFSTESCKTATALLQMPFISSSVWAPWIESRPAKPAARDTWRWNKFMASTYVLRLSLSPLPVACLGQYYNVRKPEYTGRIYIYNFMPLYLLNKTASCYNSCTIV